MSQSLNRYSYVMNNPLSMIDSSGFSWLSSAFRAIGNFFKKYWRPILAVVVAVVSFHFLAHAASAWLATEALEAGTITAAGAALAGGISSAMSTAIMGGSGSAVRGDGWRAGSVAGADCALTFGGARADIGSPMGDAGFPQDRRHCGALSATSPSSRPPSSSRSSGRAARGRDRGGRRRPSPRRRLHARADRGYRWCRPRG